MLTDSSVEALVSMKEGKSSYQSVSPRNHPVRVRKPNRRIFGTDEEEYTPIPRPRKVARPQVYKSPVTLSTPDKKAAQALGVRLRNLLKLPKAHKWVCYEWFYSNIDAPLFNGENDFCVCINETFPQLKTRKLTRVQWNKIRRLMGKPRRCSPAFFLEERAALQKKRDLIRMLQQRKTVDVAEFKDLPDEIPMPLVIGTKVTARLRSPQDGLFTGVVDAIDTATSNYRISFDRANLGSHSVRDIEVLSSEPQETMPLSSFVNKQRPVRVTTMFTPPHFPSDCKSPGLVGNNDPLLGSSPLKAGTLLPVNGSTFGGFPVDFLELLTRLTKLLAVKKEKIKELKDMNTEAEKMKSCDKTFDLPFQQKYAYVVIELEKLNTELNEYLTGVQNFCQKIAPEHGVPLLDQPSEMKQKCEEEAREMVERANMAPGRKMAKNERMLSLIAKLTSILIQIKRFSENNMHSFEFKSLQDTLDEIKSDIDPCNVSVFEYNVEVHVNHIQSGLTQMGNLHAFATSEDIATV
ncbi:hypothetical protein LSH36_193g07037 [Paralvinella palmiformis]|uniref:DIRP domain-containing protein n=1 Tax=Paralvinella palmiformis TaxID=53620 RepID=A0AAD9N518_9ANNE|nr:hypothetical protein LSH36_193g07037 [Paralvinella palmiformis]